MMGSAKETQEENFGSVSGAETRGLAVPWHKIVRIVVTQFDRSER